MTNTFVLISCCAKKRESGNYVEVFKPSENWLGKSSPITKIRGSGLWLVNELSL